MSSTIRKLIQKKFKIRGYTLKIDALDQILSFTNRFLGAEDEALDLLLDHLQSQSQKLGVRSSILDKEPVSRAITALLEADDAVDEDFIANGAVSSSTSAIRVIDAFLIPKFRYDPIKKQFHEHTGGLHIHGDASAKAALYKDRFLLLYQRVLRDSHFSKPAFHTEMSHYGSYSSNSVSGRANGEKMGDGCDISVGGWTFLLGRSYCFGFLSENTIVVAEGEMLVNGIYQVITCGFPPLEERDKSLKSLAQHDFFGGGTLTKEETLRLAELEKRSLNDMFVILSDIWVDSEEKAMGKLETVLDGFESQEVVPSLFVFMGNFCSHPCNLSFHSFLSLRSQFGRLGQMIGAHQRLKEHSRFMFIPGPEDAGPSTALPRCPLPKYLTEELQKHIPNAIFASNPCRVKFYTQEIVFFRHDLLYRMRRSCLMPPSTEETDDPFEHLVATITHQSHLCPLPLIVQPIIWNYDHCLHLYPSPHTIVLGDKSEQKAFKYTGITCFNPGSFSNDSTFVAYRPCTQEVELSAL
ncbi:hypothetical protein POTOM_041782 [Populus tomentosa]|uniref:DNA polymerase epsilon subunit n=1 Tax=Populus tomentosa TaxID=118781 RepID=A0A8X8CGD2_POPTO|nr:hypothetical protein POTOM_041782 [Populus tomentosa]